MLLVFLGAVVIACGVSSLGIKVVIAGVAILLLGLLASSEADERAKAQINRQYYWAHFYDKDQVEARQCGRARR